MLRRQPSVARYRVQESQGQSLDSATEIVLSEKARDWWKLSAAEEADVWRDGKQLDLFDTGGALTWRLSDAFWSD